MNKIVLPNGIPMPEPKLNMKDLLEKARLGWSQGKKAEAFEAVCTGLELCSAGVGRIMRDMEDLRKKVEDK